MCKSRKFNDALLLSTLPHFFCLFFICRCENTSTYYNIMNHFYSTIIICSSTLSLAWHWLREPMNFIFYLDYGFAVTWVLIEVILAAVHESFLTLITIIILNFFILFTNQVGDYFAMHKIVRYSHGHSLWHLLSSFKCITVVRLLYKDACAISNNLV
jgi:hypothetical protein